MCLSLLFCSLSSLFSFFSLSSLSLLFCIPPSHCPQVKRGGKSSCKRWRRPGQLILLISYAACHSPLFRFQDSVFGKRERSTRIERLNLGEVLFSRPFSSSSRLSLSRRTSVKENPVEEGLPRASGKRYNFFLNNCLTSFPARDFITTQSRTSWREKGQRVKLTLFALHSCFSLSLFPASRSQFSPSCWSRWYSWLQSFDFKSI